MKKAFIKGSIAIALLLGSIGLTGCDMLGSMMGNVFSSEEPEYIVEVTSAELFSEEAEEVQEDKSMPDLLAEGVDQNVLEYRGCVYITKHSISEYELYIVSDSNEKVAEEIRNAYEVLDQYLQSDEYKGEAISIAILTDSIHCHASNYIAAIENVDYSYNYYGKKEYYTVEDHISYIEPHGIDEESEIYDESIDYIINQESFWSEFEADCVNFDYFNL
ncbi:MAG: hypothetical protein IJZ42_10470 [Lachnospiraceae bacterium]|nr:hypothetical protein [Lachnospiraceae bacterium]